MNSKASGPQTDEAVHRLFNLIWEIHKPIAGDVGSNVGAGKMDNQCAEKMPPLDLDRFLKKIVITHCQLTSQLVLSSRACPSLASISRTINHWLAQIGPQLRKIDPSPCGSP